MQLFVIRSIDRLGAAFAQGVHWVSDASNTWAVGVGLLVVLTLAMSIGRKQPGT
ncbi:MAG TPA: hypothetical protein VF406_14035 [Thermodesulfobacteriota bacterium]